MSTTPAAARDLDLAVVIGTLSSDPVVSTLPSGTVLHRYEVTARHGEHTDTVPVAWFDPARPPALHAGDRVAVIGAVRRRFFRAGGATRSATEVVATSVRRATRRTQLAAALRATADSVEG